MFTLKSATVLTAAMILLAACGPARNPGYVCMHDCAHQCPDGISGDQCRRDMQQQTEDRTEYYNDHDGDSTVYDPDTYHYYYGNNYNPPVVSRTTTTYTTVTPY